MTARRGLHLRCGSPWVGPVIAEDGSPLDYCTGCGAIRPSLPTE